MSLLSRNVLLSGDGCTQGNHVTSSSQVASWPLPVTLASYKESKM